MKTPPIPIAKPCTADWSQMAGDARRRLCAQCDQHVHNLSEYTPRELQTFVEKRDGTECIAYRIRPDGSIVTRTRWSWLHTLRSRALWLLAFIPPSLFSGCAKSKQDRIMAGGITPYSRTAHHTHEGKIVPGKPAPLKNR